MSQTGAFPEPKPSAMERGAGEGRDREGRGGRRRDPREVVRLLEQLPPHAIEAEMSLLGAMLIDPHVVSDVVLELRSGDEFYKPANGAIYSAMVELYDKHGALDIVMLNQLLADRNVLSDVGGVDYLVELANAVPSAANATHFARLVREKAAIRKLIEAAGEILHDAYHSPEDAQLILEEAEQRIFAISQAHDNRKAESLQELIVEAYRNIEENDGRLITGIPTGFHDLDELTQGMQSGEMIILAARPSMGKTALALNIAEQMALTGHGVGVFSLEMSRSQLVQRLLASRSGVNSQKIRRSMLSADDHAQLQRACGELMDAPIHIDDTPGLTLLQLRAKARRMKQKHDIDAVVIDYLQLMATGGRVESRQVEISEISRGVKAMARELNVPVICLSQLNRAAEQREGHRPRMSDLRESGSIEQDADVVLMLHREEYYHQSNPDWRELNPDKVGVAELIIAKQRNGPTDTVRLSWISAITRFRDHAGYGGDYGGGGYGNAGSASSGGGYGGGAFTPGRQTGPVDGHRDGGGPDRGDLGDIPV